MGVVKFVDFFVPLEETIDGQKGGSASELDLPVNGVGGALRLHGLEQVPAEDRFVLAAMHLAPIGDLSDVEPVFEEIGERSHAEADAAALFSGFVSVRLAG